MRLQAINSVTNVTSISVTSGDGLSLVPGDNPGEVLLNLLYLKVKHLDPLVVQVQQVHLGQPVHLVQVVVQELQDHLVQVAVQQVVQDRLHNWIFGDSGGSSGTAGSAGSAGSAGHSWFNR